MPTACADWPAPPARTSEAGRLTTADCGETRTASPTWTRSSPSRSSVFLLLSFRVVLRRLPLFPLPPPEELGRVQMGFSEELIKVEAESSRHQRPRRPPPLLSKCRKSAAATAASVLSCLSALLLHGAFLVFFFLPCLLLSLVVEGAEQKAQLSSAPPLWPPSRPPRLTPSVRHSSSASRSKEGNVSKSDYFKLLDLHSSYELFIDLLYRSSTALLL